MALTMPPRVGQMRMLEQRKRSRREVASKRSRKSPAGKGRRPRMIRTTQGMTGQNAEGGHECRSRGPGLPAVVDRRQPGGQAVDEHHKKDGTQIRARLFAQMESHVRPARPERRFREFECIVQGAFDVVKTEPRTDQAEEERSEHQKLRSRPGEYRGASLRRGSLARPIPSRIRKRAKPKKANKPKK